MPSNGFLLAIIKRRAGPLARLLLLKLTYMYINCCFMEGAISSYVDPNH